MVLCCRCNRTGSCRGCACVKAGKRCSNCLPSKLETCSNASPTPAPIAATLTLTAIQSAATPIPRGPATNVLDMNGVPGSLSDSQATSDTPTQHPDSISFPPCSPQLPTFQPTSMPVFSWGNHNAEDFSHALEASYSEVVHWRLNSFKVPLGKAGKEFVHELSRLFLAFASASSMESIALKATIVLPILLLQKPHRR